MSSQPLDVLPLWAVYVLTAIFLFLAAEAGFRLGKLVQKRWPDQSEPSVGAIVGAALALLGFLLAFVTGITIDNYNQRSEYVISEANAIGAAYLRAGYLADPYKQDARALLREYVMLRTGKLTPAAGEAAIARSEEIHIELWRMAQELAKAEPGPTIALYLTSLNDVMDLHTRRVSAELDSRVPPDLIFGLYGVAGLAMVLIGLFDSYREKHNIVALIIAVLIIAAVFVMIVDMDRTDVGILQIPQKALLDLQHKLINER